MKTVKTTVTLAALLSLVSPFLSAQEAKPSEKDYFSIKNEAVTLTAVEAGRDAVPPAPAGLGLLNVNKGAEGGLANAGLAAWSVITSGTPSAGYASAYASAIPGLNSSEPRPKPAPPAAIQVPMSPAPMPPTAKIGTSAGSTALSARRCAGP